jgi:hypothetical protein
MGMVIKANELAKTRGWFLTRQFENEANPDMHSRTTALEILEDFRGSDSIFGSPDMEREARSKASRVYWRKSGPKRR